MFFFFWSLAQLHTYEARIRLILINPRKRWWNVEQCSSHSNLFSFFFMHPNQNVRVSSYEAISCHSTWPIWLYTNIFVLLYRLRGVKRFSNKLCLESRDFTKRKEKDQDQTSLPKDLGYSLLQFSYLGVVCFVQSDHWRRAGDFSWRGCRRSAQFFLWSV